MFLDVAFFLCNFAAMTIEETLEKLKIDRLNEMQEATVNALLHTDKDVVVLSPTGSGKTLAYLLPLCQRLDATLNALQAVVVVPGRELAVQSATVLTNMKSGLRGLPLYGGHSTMEEHRRIKEVMPQIVFATPGRIIDHLNKRNLSVETVKWLVIDEFDKCLAIGFRDEMTEICGLLHQAKRHILLSATDAEEIPQFVSLKRTVRIDFRPKDETALERVSLYVVKSAQRDKLNALRNLLCSLGDESSIVFLNYRDSVERTTEYLHQEGFAASMFHGGMSQEERERALYRFSNGSANIFVSTDLASRGLDIPMVKNVIHYHLPLAEENYIHRVGRTARWDATGNTFFLLGPDETLPTYIAQTPLEYALPNPLPAPAPARMATIYIGKGKKNKISKADIVGFLCKKGGLNMADIGRIDVKEYYSYVAVTRSKQAQIVKMSAQQPIKGQKTRIEPIR